MRCGAAKRAAKRPLQISRSKIKSWMGGVEETQDATWYQGCRKTSVDGAREGIRQAGLLGHGRRASKGVSRAMGSSADRVLLRNTVRTGQALRLLISVKGRVLMELKRRPRIEQGCVSVDGVAGGNWGVEECTWKTSSLGRAQQAGRWK